MNLGRKSIKQTTRVSLIVGVAVPASLLILGAMHDMLSYPQVEIQAQACQLRLIDILSVLVW